eukprot:TRINITY_DN32208_c0_g1_i1.p2 TRINITY_DN32208_c0_g1~~TRINITY_DN32208_c0_g1_i1.p2  ORF type:complete len:424 (+),score=149.66 TRINITY_DN32208_c0_g1_i1:52-1323(+)
MAHQRSWVAHDADSDFPIQNIPFGVYQLKGQEPRCCTAIGDQVVDLKELANAGHFEARTQAAFQEKTLNAFMGLKKADWTAARKVIQGLLDSGCVTLSQNAALKAKVFHNLSDVQMLLPCQIGDYTDFYSSREHATNLGKMFRPGGAPLLPNWLHLPVGYHGRSSSIVPSGTPIRRPCGQTRPDDTKPPVFTKCKLLDMEVEVAAYVGTGTELGDAISINDAKDHVFGLSLFNDWSARDMQKWEYVPLGPFLAKNFASTVSPWIITMDALEPFIVAGPPQGVNGDPEPLPYLQQNYSGAVDLKLSAKLRPAGTQELVTLTETNFKYMYWSVFQQLTHHTVNGVNVKPGDMYASGTISGPNEGSYGSMIEITWRGTKPVDCGKGGERKFFQDGDSVMMSGYCEGEGYRIGFGPCEGTILPAHEL